MIRLTDLAGNNTFTMGGRKLEYGKVYSNPYATAFKPVNEAEGSEDHEVSMAQNQLDSIIKSATELKGKMGEEEKQIPAWIQDHITNSENYISQAASNYHEYGDSNEIKFDEIRVLSKEEFQNEASDMELVKNMEKTIKNLQYMLTKAKHPKEKENLKANIAANIAIMNWWKSRGKDESVNEAPAQTKGEKIQRYNDRVKKLRDKISSTKNSEQKMKYQTTLKGILQRLSDIKKDHGIKAPHREDVVVEAGPCWKGYKQVGMKDKGGKQVPNCVPEGFVNEGSINKMFIAFLGLQNKVREYEDKQKQLLQPYLAAKKANNVTAMNKAVEALKKNQKTLEMYRRNLNTVETKYIQNLDRDAEYTGEI